MVANIVANIQNRRRTLCALVEALVAADPDSAHIRMTPHKEETTLMEGFERRLKKNRIIETANPHQHEEHEQQDGPR